VPDEAPDAVPPGAAAFDPAAAVSDDEPVSTLADASPAPAEVGPSESDPVSEASAASAAEAESPVDVSPVSVAVSRAVSPAEDSLPVSSPVLSGASKGGGVVVGGGVGGEGDPLDEHPTAPTTRANINVERRNRLIFPLDRNAW